MALVADIPRRTLALPCYVVALCPVFAVTHLLTALAPECSLTGLLTHVAAPARGALARSSCRVALASVLALALQHAARPEPVVLAASFAISAGEPRRTHAGTSIVLTCGTMLAQTGVLAIRAVASLGASVLTGGAGVARGANAGAGHAVACPSVVAKAYVLAVAAPSVHGACFRTELAMFARRTDARASGGVAGRPRAAPAVGPAVLAPEPVGTRPRAESSAPTWCAHAGARYVITLGPVGAAAVHGTA